MADTAQTLEDLTCAICVDHFRDPVMLPCQHTYCRECIRAHAEKSRPKETSDISESSTVLKQDWLISCPLCQKEASLGRDGVDGLPNNIYLAGMVDKPTSGETTEENGPWCSLCEEGHKTKAAKFCTSCRLRYCESCLVDLHPVRGEFRRHRLISAEGYGLQRSTETLGKTGETDQELCVTHSKLLIMYCDACHQLICIECLTEHDGHAMRDKETVYRKLKEPIVEKTNLCKELKDSMNDFVSEVNGFLQDIEGNEGKHKAEIEKAYSQGLEVLNTWRRDALEIMDNRHLSLTSQSKTVLTELLEKLAEIEKMIQEEVDLPTSLTEAFLQMSRNLTARLHNQLPKVTGFMKDQRETMTNLEEYLNLDPAVPIHLDVKLDAVKVPKMKFISTFVNDLTIMEQCRKVMLVGGSQQYCEAWTDGCFQTGCYYWQIEISAISSMKNGNCICSVGVKHENYTLNDKAGAKCWWVGIDHLDGKARMKSPCGEIKKVYKEWFTDRNCYTFGFYLNCETLSLIIIDSEQDDVILTLRSVDLSKPLVPAVDFSGLRLHSATARLITDDLVSLPTVLWSTL